MSEEQKPLVMEETQKLEEGKYTGVIHDFVRNTKNYDYMRYKIKVDEQENVILDLSFPSYCKFLVDGTPMTQHAKFLVDMGIDYKKGAVIDFTSLKGKKVSFLVIDEKTEKGDFTRIVKKSIKPI